MKLVTLIQNNEWSYVQPILTALYPDENNLLKSYEAIYYKLNRLPPVASETKIVLKEVGDTIGSYINVGGIKPTSKEHISLDFIPWCEWLDMQIDPDTLQKFTALEIISHCLWEMTFYSFDEAETQSIFSDLKKEADKYS